jgi:hypothetical protein
MQYAKPEIGAEIEIVTNTPNPTQPFALPNTYRGIVVKALKWVTPDDFCMTTDRPEFPVRVVDIKNVASLRFLDGSEAKQIEVRSVPKIQSWTVEGSKGDVYIVTKDNDKWACDCVAGRFGRNCKHVASIQCKEV